jgi:hypothetical protein
MTDQFNIEFARQARDKGIKRAVDHADKDTEKWSDIAYGFLKEFIRIQKQSFLAEDFRMAVTELIPEPPHNRAFGGLFMRAAKAGLITRVGFGPVKNWKAHRANASIWKRA